ncbi:methyltransferase domain-containing protein [[Mycobacterium] nativiensis]|uniref:Methyltransferase domain-containing protein n=1 Tax=[Mycobacterium] nativiensis TaxID=2855503 RepID=A0ABU5XZ85_9MYCO|nr:methyltransferase domain-containing protein [Mycolicibacter sp. MYC340]MEB3032000.1 methyltransferase domain-containing protein [Mycolicibacter sp. MYC340]
MTFTAQPTAAGRALNLLEPGRYGRIHTAGPGYYDLLGDNPPPVRNLAQRMMRTRLYSAGYQIGRPIGFRLASGLKAPGRDSDRTRVASWLGLRSGATVIDIGCGPGNFTGWFGTQVAPDGLAVGLDASAAMLRRASADNSGSCVAYLRGDAENLPFADEVADAVSCLAALYLINEPFQTVCELVRVLKPGGRVVILTTLIPGGTRTPARGAVLDTISGVRWFGSREITGLLADLGCTGIRQHVDGLAQTVVATKQ